MRFFMGWTRKGEKGDKGNDGTSATIAVNQVTTGAAGSNAGVLNVGTAQAALLNFVIPRGDAGAAGVNAFAAPTSRTVVAGTAYQATTSAKPALISTTITSNAALSLAGGTTFTADIVIGPAATIATTGGTTIARYMNSLTGTLVVGLAINTSSTQSFLIPLPAGWYFAVRNVTGTPTILMTFDQVVG